MVYTPLSLICPSVCSQLVRVFVSAVCCVRVMWPVRMRSADLDSAMATLRVWDLPSARELGMDAASRSTLLQ